MTATKERASQELLQGSTKERVMFRMKVLSAAALFGMVLAPGHALAQGNKLVIGAPGTPPVFAGVILYVAEEEGFFKQQGLEVTIRPFETGVGAARSVLAGDIDISLTPTNMIINQMSNTNSNLVGIYGLPNPDWVVASLDPARTQCRDLVGQMMGVDAIGGARSTALSAMLLGGCPDVKMQDLKQVSLSSNAASVMTAGRLDFGVLHLDDLAVLEAHGKKPYRVLEMNRTNPTAHYLLTVARQDKLAENRDAYVGVIAALIKAARFMQEPKNADRVAKHAAPTGHDKEIAKLALKQFLHIGFWAVNDDGMDKKKLDAMIELSVRTGGVRPGNQAVTVERLVNRSVWNDANNRVK